MMTRPYLGYVIHDIIFPFLFPSTSIICRNKTTTLLGKRARSAQYPQLFPFSFPVSTSEVSCTNKRLEHRRPHLQLPMAIRSTHQQLPSQFLNSSRNNSHTSHNHRNNSHLTRQRQRRLAQLVVMDGAQPTAVAQCRLRQRRSKLLNAH